MNVSLIDFLLLQLVISRVKYFSLINLSFSFIVNFWLKHSQFTINTRVNKLQIILFTSSSKHYSLSHEPVLRINQPRITLLASRSWIRRFCRCAASSRSSIIERQIFHNNSSSTPLAFGFSMQTNDVKLFNNMFNLSLSSCRTSESFADNNRAIYFCANNLFPFNQPIITWIKFNVNFF